MKIGVVGLGAIGSAVATNLVTAGFETIVWNRSSQPVEALVAQGAARAARIEDAFACGIVLSVLFDDDAVRDVILDSGVLASADAGTIHACLSTISTGLVRELVQAHERHGLAYVAAPVFGRRDAAAAAQLVIATAGAAADLDAVEPVLSALGRTFRMGEDPQLGHLAKITGNLMIVSAVETMRESAALIRSLGGDPAPFLAMMGDTLFAAPIYRSYGATIAGRGAAARTPAAFEIVLKDLGLAVGEAQASATPMPLASLLRDQMRRAPASASRT